MTYQVRKESEAGEFEGGSGQSIDKVADSQTAADRSREQLVSPHGQREFDCLQPGELNRSAFQTPYHRSTHLGQTQPQLEERVDIWSPLRSGWWGMMVCKRRRVEVEEERVAELDTHV